MGKEKHMGGLWAGEKIHEPEVAHTVEAVEEEDDDEEASRCRRASRFRFSRPFLTCSDASYLSFPCCRVGLRRLSRGTTLARCASIRAFSAPSCMASGSLSGSSSLPVSRFSWIS